MSDEQPTVPSVLIVLQDNVATGEIEIGGMQRPLEFNPASAAHVIGKFIAEHIGEICAAAMQETKANSPDVGESVIGPDRERTLVLPT